MKILQRIPIFLVGGCILFLLYPCANCFGFTPETEINEGEKVMVDSNLYKLSQEEKDWYGKFQNGIPFFDGWKQISQNLIADFPYEDRIHLKENLKDLGEKIGIEWCKDNAVRKIDTEMLRQWGKVLSKAVDDGIAHVTDTINRVEKEVDDILISKFSSAQKYEN